jgi:hypothetical protein
LTTARAETVMTVTLTYLAQGFDWQANYIGQAKPGGAQMRLFAWLTIANGGAQSFKDARLQVVAGAVNKEEAATQPQSTARELRLRCWPMGTTKQRRAWVPPLPPPAAVAFEGHMDEVIVTAQRREKSMRVASAAMMAEQEDLGDLKLYRVPERVTVAAQSQKQVGMFDQPAAKFRRVYTANAEDEGDEPEPMQLELRSKNERVKGLGLPLPAGSIVLFEQSGPSYQFIGEDGLADRTVGDDVEIAVGESSDVQLSLTITEETSAFEDWRADLSNATKQSINAEIMVPHKLAKPPRGAKYRADAWRLPVTVPANGKATISYRVLKPL